MILQVTAGVLARPHPGIVSSSSSSSWAMRTRVVAALNRGQKHVFSVFYICSRPPMFLYHRPVTRHKNDITHFLLARPLLINESINFSTFYAVYPKFC